MADKGRRGAPWRSREYCAVRLEIPNLVQTQCDDEDVHFEKRFTGGSEVFWIIGLEGLRRLKRNVFTEGIEVAKLSVHRLCPQNLRQGAGRERLLDQLPEAGCIKDYAPSRRRIGQFTRIEKFITSG